MELLNQFESQILLWMQEHLRISILNRGMIGLSWLNNAGMLSVLVVLIFLVWRRYRAAGTAMCASLLLEFILINLILKPVVNRPRPYVINPALQLLGQMPGDASFPSGHTGAAFAVAIAMFLCLPRKAGVPALLMASAIAFSRLYNAVHYPTDVIAAFLAAWLTAVLAYRFVYPRALKRFPVRE